MSQSLVVPQIGVESFDGAIERASESAVPPRIRKGPSGRKFSDEARNQQMIRMFRSGSTSTEIGKVFGLVPTGVSALLRSYGIKRSEGGKEVAAAKRRALLIEAQRLEKQACKYEKHGVSEADFSCFAEFADALEKYRSQKSRANTRQITWTLTFGQWWGVWAESGQWAMRGRCAGNSAVMARHGDTGPYSLGNVYITTLAKNFVDSHLFRGHRIKGEASHAAVLSSCLAKPINANQLCRGSL